jgi:hypothetical protein
MHIPCIAQEIQTYEIESIFLITLYYFKSYRMFIVFNNNNQGLNLIIKLISNVIFILCSLCNVLA